MKIKSTILYTLFFALLVLTAGASFFRFVIKKDYLVSFETECDPLTQNCFIGCDDDCNNEYYFSITEGGAYELYKNCGKDVSSCEYAQTCNHDTNANCSTSYCDPEIDGEESCETITNNEI